MISPQQCRAARAWLGWTQAFVVERAGSFARDSLIDFEVRYNLTLLTYSGPRLRQLFENAGIRFLFASISDTDELGIGIAIEERLRKRVFSPDARVSPQEVRARAGMVKRRVGGDVHRRFAGLISPEQSRAARAWLGWSQQDLSRYSCPPNGEVTLAVTAIKEFEGERPRTYDWDISIATKLFANAGIELTFDSLGRANGIRMRSLAPGLTPGVALR